MKLQFMDDNIREDFRRLARVQEEWGELLGENAGNELVEYLADYWFERYIRLTKNDDDLKAIFALALDKYDIEDVFGMFVLCGKIGDYSLILR
ncbi:MAG TPA: hypothetical protein GX708_01710 [Gallicola sp.]|nr:hypothetical protein [Gallicola sp.]